MSYDKEELVLLAEGSYIEITMQENILRNNKIPCLVRSVYGQGYVLHAGSLLETYRLFVYGADWEEASELLGIIDVSDL